MTQLNQKIDINIGDRYETTAESRLFIKDHIIEIIHISDHVRYFYRSNDVFVCTKDCELYNHGLTFSQTLESFKIGIIGLKFIKIEKFQLKNYNRLSMLR
jgi:hypothetical protein